MDTQILNIETSATVCSVTLSRNGVRSVWKEKSEGYTHAEDLHVFIREVLKEAGILPRQLDAIAVGLGPGSYTGLRIGMSAAKGLCYALSRPLIGISTLQSMAWQVRNELVQERNALLCPLIDARRMEVYCSVFDGELREIEKVHSKVITAESIATWKKSRKMLFFGSGMEKCRKLISENLNADFVEGILPSSLSMCRLAEDKFRKKEFEDVAYCEPLYAKEFYDTRKIQKE